MCILHQEGANLRSVFLLMQFCSNDNLSAKLQLQVLVFPQSQTYTELISSAAKKILLLQRGTNLKHAFNWPTTLGFDWLQKVQLIITGKYI